MGVTHDQLLKIEGTTAIGDQDIITVVICMTNMCYFYMCTCVIKHELDRIDIIYFNTLVTTKSISIPCRRPTHLPS